MSKGINTPAGAHKPYSTTYFTVGNTPPDALKQQLLHWAAAHELSVYLDSNGQSGPEGWECLAAGADAPVLELPAHRAFLQLKSHVSAQPGWLFGFLGYDLKNETERLKSKRFDGVGLPDMGFFAPDTVAGIRNGRLEIHTSHADPQEIYRTILSQAISNPAPQALPALRPRISHAEYLHTVDAIRRHIVDGDVYEMNFCQEFYAERTEIDPIAAFQRLNGISQAPFAAFMRWRDRYLLCGSPERFLKKDGDLLRSQPIKGTRKRGQTPEEDALIRRELASSIKDRAENVMIVDLVRNDLARNCRPGSVRVPELFGIHTFNTVHQMISTVEGRLRPEAHAVDALRDAFPMGSMTGAPKVMAMELIERYERSRRGLYSGTVGYFDPEGNFDFNVVIRSILYQATHGYVSTQVGGAIVYDSDPQQEYDECLLKAQAMRRALGG